MSLPYYLLAAAVLLGAMVKTRDLRAAPAPLPVGLKFLTLALYLLAAAFLLLANASRPLLDEVADVENLARWAGNSCTLLSAASMQMVLAHFARRPGSPPSKAWWRFVLGGAASVGMALAILPGERPDRDDFLDAYAHVGSVAVYLMLYLAYLGWALVDTLLMAWRYAPHAAPWTRRGLRVLSAGCITGLGYIAIKATFVMVRLSGRTTGGAEQFLGPILALAAALLILIGLTGGSWGPPLANRLDQWRSYRRLGRLWRPLNRAFPQIRLDRAGNKVSTRLLRRVVEIRDGQLALMPYIDAQIVEDLQAAGRARGLSDDDLEVAVEAAMTEIALICKESGCPPVPPAKADAPETTEIADLDAEVGRLLRVAHAFHRCSLPLPSQCSHRTGATAPLSDQPPTETTS